MQHKHYFGENFELGIGGEWSGKYKLQVCP